jgi:hypothetical protein
MLLVELNERMLMKTLFALFALLAAIEANAQLTNSAPAPAPGPFQAQAAARAKETPAVLLQPKPNEIVVGNVTYSGIVVEAVKTGKPLQLLNPVAPPIYGAPEDNVSRNLLNGKITGLKFFAIRF